MHWNDRAEKTDCVSPLNVFLNKKNIVISR